MNKIAIPTFIIIFVITALIGVGVFQNKVETAEKKLIKIEEKVEKTEEEVEENEKIDLRQTILIEQISATLEKLNKKLDKDLIQ